MNSFRTYAFYKFHIDVVSTELGYHSKATRLNICVNVCALFAFSQGEMIFVYEKIFNIVILAEYSKLRVKHNYYNLA